jgi:hypothetical protein
MWWDFFLFITIGPLIGFFIYLLMSHHKNRSEEHLKEIRENSHLVC